MKVSIAMVAYNHARFLAQALDSVLSQKVDFDYEIIVGEDASQDDTASILQIYAEKYPDKVIPLIRKKNLGMTRNILDVLGHCTGEYIAFLEGDDFWISDNKLRRQIDFLDSNRDYSAVVHCSYVVDSKGEIQENDFYSGEKEDRDYLLENLERFELPFQTSSIVVRNYSEEFLGLAKKVMKNDNFPADRLFPFFMLKKGKVRILSEIMGAYRFYIEEGGTNWSSRYDIRAKNNYLYHDCVIRRVEQIAHKYGFQVNIANARGKLLYDSYLYARRGHFFCWIQCLFMIVLGPKRVCMLKEFWRIHKENKRRYARK